MKYHKQSSTPLLSALVLTLTLLRAAAAQSMPPSGAFGFVGGVSQIDSNGGNGGAILGLLNFDGAGNVTGTATVKPRSTDNQRAQPVPSKVTGTDSSNPDGTGSLTLAYDVGFSATFAMVATNGGSVSGNFLAAVFGTVCRQNDFETLSGLVTGSVSPGGATSLVLHAAGGLASGVARAAQTGGSQLLLLRTDNNTGFDAAFGTARLQ
jgi:hypothetical protein